MKLEEEFSGRVSRGANPGTDSRFPANGAGNRCQSRVCGVPLPTAPKTVKHPVGLETPRCHERIVSSGEIRRPDPQAKHEGAHPARQWLTAPDGEPGRTHFAPSLGLHFGVRWVARKPPGADTPAQDTAAKESRSRYVATVNA